MDSIWLHGWATDSRVYEPVLSALAPEQAANATAADLPGYDRNNRVDGADYSVWIRDLLLSRGKSEPVLLGGWSLGGMLALAAASALPDRVASLVLISTSARFVRDRDNPHGKDRRVVRAMLHRLRRNSAAVVESFIEGMFSDGESGKAREFISEQAGEKFNFSPACLANGLNYLLESDHRELVSRVVCPVLLIHGSEDSVTDIRLGRWLAESISGSSLLELRGAGHAPLLTRADECARGIESFIDNCAEG
jgi:pimeloyl-[acyl-carrier protein] methyl ester esterase